MPPSSQEIDGDEDDVVMTVLGALEDMLYESVTFGAGVHSHRRETTSS